MALRDIVVLGFGNGTYDPGINKLPTLGYSISETLAARITWRPATAEQTNASYRPGGAPQTISSYRPSVGTMTDATYRPSNPG